MTKLAIIYHSGYGHTEKMAHHVKKGAASVDGVETLILKLEDGNEDFSAANDADAIIFGSPTYMGSVSAVMKNFMEICERRKHELNYVQSMACIGNTYLMTHDFQLAEEYLPPVLKINSDGLTKDFFFALLLLLPESLPSCYPM